MSPRSRDAGLVDLLMDTLGADEPPLELLVRYAQDPASLAREERAQIERRLADSPTYAEELRALQRMLAVAAPRAPASAPSAAARLRAWFAGLFEFQAAGWGLAAAAAAALVLALYTVLWRAPGEPSGPGPVVAQRPEPPPPAVEPRPESPPVRAEIPPEPAAPPAAAPEPVRPAGTPAKPAPVMLAMAAPAYAAPEGSSELGTHGGIIRGAGAPIALRALAPAHAGLSATPAPELFWHLASLPAPGAGSFELIVQDPDSPDPLLVTSLEVSEPGLQRVSLAERGVALAPGVDYAWSIAYRTDPGHASRDPFARGWVRHVPAPAALASLPPAEAPRALAAAGYWYDALAAVQRARDAQPDNASVRAAWNALLASAALELP